MSRRARAARLAAALTLIGPGAAALAFTGRAPHPDGPPPGHTGGFGEPTCHSCHSFEDPDAPGGDLRLLGLPERYQPGHSYRLTVVVARPGMARAGFQLAARWLNGDSAGRNAGTLRTTDGRAAVIPDSVGIAYAQHVLGGTDVRSGRGQWPITWTAPSRAGVVRFNIASVAANDDNSPFGDFVYRLEGSLDGRR